MKRRKTAAALIRLTRYQEYLIFVTVTTLLGFVFSKADSSVGNLTRLILVHIANILSVCFSFMINDVEDAPDDALSPDKVKRNPVSSGALSRRLGFSASLGTAMVACILFFPLGTIPFLLGLLTNILGFLYSWKVIRLKSKPAVDLISHSLMLAALQFMCSYFTFSPFKGFIPEFTLPLLLVTSMSMYGELYNEVRDFTVDKMAGLRHTAMYLGKEITHILMYILLSISGGSILYAIFLHMIPMWFIMLYLVLGGFFFFNFLTTYFLDDKSNHTDDAQQYILVITAVCLTIWTLVRFLRLGG